jgi:hypothetical protein
MRAAIENTVKFAEFHRLKRHNNLMLAEYVAHIIAKQDELFVTGALHPLVAPL